ncbi:MAG: hypothetical protein HZB54_06570 [Deltaproteobacteria bacterium]|nr:hypothetical protein [Deltaproteobacteria bacterium]
MSIATGNIHQNPYPIPPHVNMAHHFLSNLIDGGQSEKDTPTSSRKIAIKNLATLQTCDLPAILRYRTIFTPHRIGEHTARCK